MAWRRRGVSVATWHERSSPSRLQYRSGFYYFDDEQKMLIEAGIEAYQKALAAAGKGRPITTEVAAAADYDQYGGLWYYAEGYHQQVEDLI